MERKGGFFHFKTTYNKTDTTVFSFTDFKYKIYKKLLHIVFLQFYNLCKNWSHILTVTWYKLKHSNDQGAHGSSPLIENNYLYTKNIFT